MKENKRLICELLADVLRQTRAGEELSSIRYTKTDGGTEVATVCFATGTQIGINVTADSGISMIRDIVKAFYEGRCEKDNCD